MNSKVLLVVLLLVAAACSVGAQQSIEKGDWAGSLLLRKQPTALQGSAPETYTFAFMLHILREDRGITLDIPEQGMFGYPLDRYAINENNITFVLDSFVADEELALVGNYSASFSPQESTKKGGIVGSVRGRSWSGSFYLQRQVLSESQGAIFVDIPVTEGLLPATLIYPARAKSVLDAESPQEFPLIILVSGAGKTDRDGNNVDVPGKTDTLKQLASGLRERNVGTLRYDKRGIGEAYKLENPGQMTSFSQHIQDLARVIEFAAELPRRGRLILAGMNEGAWMASAALGLLSPEVQVDGLIMLDASGISPMELLKQSLDSLSKELESKALEAAETLVKTGNLINVPPDLQDFFSPARAMWLSTWLAFDPIATLKTVKIPVLLVYGSSDVQVDWKAFSKLAETKPEAVVRIVPNMNYVLKEVHSEDENYAAFTDPAYKIPVLLVDLIASYAKAQPAPDGLLSWLP
jgi:alpha-beta hydrolase superfamily lysophospholipase